MFKQKFLSFALVGLVLASCGDDDNEAKTKGQFTLADETTKIASGLFEFDTTPDTDIDDNTYHRNTLIFFGEGLRIEVTGDEYETIGEGNMLTLDINNNGQELEVGTYTWEPEENEQPFDLRGGLVTLNVNTGNELDYRMYSGTVTVTKSGSIYKISFTGTAYAENQGVRQLAGLPLINVTAEFEGKLSRMGFDFYIPVNL